ncbi:MAG: glucose 1-dehydrogenase [Pirellulales bacterium]|nr:glucose 1-dehydrogenase [Pirellulales bacterium]
MRRLENKIAVITGAGRGIGFAAAVAFAREGAKVVIAEIDDQTGRRAAERIRNLDADAAFVRTDCSRPEEVQNLMARTLELYGGLNVLYNNASVFLRDDAPATQLDEAVWQRVLRTNLDSVFLCSKYGIPLIVASGGGSVINTGSSASLIGIPGCDAYTAAKGATVALTRSLAVTYGRKGVRVNCICPAGVETEMLRQSNLENPDFDSEFFFSRAPLARFGTPEEIAQVAVFLASDESSYINGAILRADGGITIAPIS